MDSLDLIQTFQEVARRSSFSATARAQGVSPASVSKAIAQLEARFGLRLFHRTTRKVSLTDAGHLLLERTGPLLAMIDVTQSELHQRATHPSGRLALTAPHDLMRTDLPTVLTRFLQENANVAIDLHITDRIVDLAEEGVDLAFRIGPIGDSRLIARRLLPVKIVAAAAPAYWKRHGKPTRPEQLREHVQVAYVRYGEAAHWSFNVNGKPFELPLQPVFSVTDHTPLASIAAQGLGVICAARIAIASYLKRGELEPALEAFSPQDIWLYVAYMERRYKSAALRALLEHLDKFAHELQGKLSEQEPASA